MGGFFLGDERKDEQIEGWTTGLRELYAVLGISPSVWNTVA